MTKDINRKVVARGTRVANALRTAELEVLKGNRSGRVYKKPDTYGKSRTKSTRKLLKDYGHKLKGGQLYRASAAGEAPARRTGALRLQWLVLKRLNPLIKQKLWLISKAIHHTQNI